MEEGSVQSHHMITKCYKNISVPVYRCIDDTDYQSLKTRAMSPIGHPETVHSVSCACMNKKETLHPGCMYSADMGS